MITKICKIGTKELIVIAQHEFRQQNDTQHFVKLSQTAFGGLRDAQIAAAVVLLQMDENTPVHLLSFALLLSEHFNLDDCLR